MARGRHHRVSNARRVLTVATAGAGVLALTGAVASASPAPPAPDCVGLIQALVTAQIGDNDSGKRLAAAEANDRAALDKRNQAKIDAQTQYKNVDYPAAAATKDDTATSANERTQALQAALDKRNAAFAEADKAYTEGGTAAALERARREDGSNSNILAAVQLKVAKLCIGIGKAPDAGTPPPVSGPATVPAPVPPVQQLDGTGPTVTH